MSEEMKVEALENLTTRLIAVVETLTAKVKELETRIAQLEDPHAF